MWVEPAIELEQHPGGNPRPVQEFQGLKHQVVEIEHPVQSFALFIGAQHGIAESDQRQRRSTSPARRGRPESAGSRSRLGLQHGAGVGRRGLAAPPW
jgi:hypothetical protein